MINFNQDVYDALMGGLFDHLEHPDDFSELLTERFTKGYISINFYLHAVTKLEQNYGDKSYREYAAWFEALDAAWEAASEYYWRDLDD